ncbi:Permease of the drug/metabolite transporter (DMT) superfamily [Labilithrix luteola]|uniref:Permease of the drug/metabolite transporter (DMT) superfamily n=1 Tax=Labilithrix luteola TaxID=1391654 RepID=A0A0K1QEB5_9BACT|nr:EamA family transporter [Labilithrix luteola]AKV04111.1 Permease of the drug/metabolite transporter (DMT) superfamily [Labilithrix luteola]
MNASQVELAPPSTPIDLSSLHDVAASPASKTLRIVRRIDARLAFALVCVWLLWGSTYLAMRFVVSEIPPFMMAGSRFLCAGSALLAFARARGAAFPSAKTWTRAIPIGALLFLGGNGFIVVAEQSLPSTIAAAVCATTPLIVAAIGALRGDRPKRGELVGMAFGLCGVIVLALGTPLAGAGLRGLLIILGPITFALGSLLVRREGPSAGLAHSAAHMIAGGFWMIMTSLVLHERVPAHVGFGAIGAWLWLVVFGSLVGFSAYTWLLRNARPAVAMSFAYVNPIVAVLLGALIGGEPLGVGTIASTALIAVGVMCAILLRQ